MGTMQPVDLNEDKSLALEAEDDGQISLWQLPKIFWAALLVFGLNVGLAIVVLFGPELHVDMYGDQEERVVLAAESKPSPFVGTPEEKPRKVRVAEKLTPVLVEAGASGSYHPASYSEVSKTPRPLIAND
jgi:hypothetical protein